MSDQSFSIPSRRSFLQMAAAGSAAGLPAIQAEEKSALPWEFCTFTKALQHMSYDEVSEVIADIGFDGVESAVRPKGHVEPERVQDDLPKMMASLKKYGLNLTVMTSGINEVSKEQYTESVLRTAADLGVKRFRMGYYKYDLKKPIRKQLDEFRPRLRDLVALTKELGIKPVYQNHSGSNYFGAPLWDLAEVFEEFDPAHIGAAFDIGHATIEGSKAWPLHFAVIKPYFDTVYVKEPYWVDNKVKMGPLGKGGVDKRFYKVLKKSKFSGPISLHVEHLGHKDPKMVPTVIKAIREEFGTLKSLLASA